MQIQLKQFQNGMPIKLQSQDLTAKVKQMRQKKRFQEMLEFSQTLSGHEKYIVKANALFYMDKFEELIKCCDKGLNISQQPEFYNFKGRAYGKQSKYRQKVQQTQKAIALNPKVPAYHRNMGAGLYKMKKYQQAIQCHTKAIQLEPKNSINYHNKGAALFRMGKFEQAKDFFISAINIDNNLVLSIVWLGNTEAQLKDYIKAIQHYQKAYELTKNSQYEEKAKKLKKILANNNGEGQQKGQSFFGRISNFFKK